MCSIGHPHVFQYICTTFTTPTTESMNLSGWIEQGWNDVFTQFCMLAERKRKIRTLAQPLLSHLRTEMPTKRILCLYSIWFDSWRAHDNSHAYEHRVMHTHRFRRFTMHTYLDLYFHCGSGSIHRTPHIDVPEKCLYFEFLQINKVRSKKLKTYFANFLSSYLFTMRIV